MWDAVAPHAGSENWNSRRLCFSQQFIVAPHTGSENWNIIVARNNNRLISRSPCGERELKFQDLCRRENTDPSLPTLGAWIEIQRVQCYQEYTFGAPHARARIEITRRTTRKPARTITPHTGNENWNCSANLLDLRQNDRSPYGERELKSNNVNNTAYGIWSLPTRGVWIEIDVNQIFGAIENDRSPYGE